MDIALIIDKLAPGADYRRADNLATLAETWADDRPIPSEAEINAAWAEIEANRIATATQAQDKAAKKTALFLDLKTRLAADLNIQVESPADLSGKIEEIIPAARLKRDGKATTGDRLNELEKQVELLTTFVALLSRS